jgi:RNA polymerase sigma-70 factor (ECF subfamily)
VVDRAHNPLLGALLAPVAPPAIDPTLAAGEAGRVTKEEVFDLVYRQIRKLAGRRHDVDELTQAAAEQVLRSLPTFEGRARLSTWTFRICYLTIRKHDRWYRRWLRRFAFTEDGELPESISEGEASDARFSRKEDLARLQAALDQLSPKRRAVVVMHDIEGLSIDEIASVVGAKPVAVRSRLRDGRKVLAEALASDPYFGEQACARGGKR